MATRGLGSILLVFVGAFAACSDDTPSSAPADAGTSADAGSDQNTTPEDSGAKADGQAQDAATVITLHGKAVEQNGLPLAGCLVATSLGTATTGADGSFTLDAPSTYDLAVVSSDKTTALVVVGLTRTDPLVPLPAAAGPAKSATVVGSFPAVTTGQSAQLVFVPTTYRPWMIDYRLFNSPAAGYSRFVDWRSPNDLALKLWLFQYTQGVDNSAASFLGYATATTSLAADETKTVDFASTNTVTTGTINAVMTVPPGYSKGGSLFALMRPTGASERLPINQSLSASLSFSMPVPEIAGATYAIALRASKGPGGAQSLVRKSVALGATLTETLPAAVELAEPAAGASGIDGSTTFRWTGGTGVNLFSLLPNEEAAAVYVVTAAGSAKVPDLAALGLTLPAAHEYTWSVTTYPALTTTDAFVADPVVDLFCTPYGAAGGDDMTCTFSDQRPLTTK